ncbi:MAG: RHS repeat-associated core domain-containing protein [Acidobacteriota bacterium]
MKRSIITLLLAVFGAATNLQAQSTWTTGSYSYDSSGNIWKVGSDAYVYDSLSRLTSANTSGNAQSMAYDIFGNLKQLVTSQTTMIPGVDPSTNRLTSTTGGANYFGTYDNAGNMITAPGDSYVYDGLNTLTQLTGPSGQHDVYVYSADDERIGTISVSGTSPNLTATYARWTPRDLGNQVLREYDNMPSTGTWTWKEDYVYANGQLLAAETNTADHTMHFFPDHLGTPRLITGSGGAVLSRHTYYPFGDEITATAQDSETHKFTGHERDLSADYMHARYYVPGVGRFLSVDPLPGKANQPQSWNRYAYVLNNPIGATDPDGKEPNSIQAGGLNGFLAVVRTIERENPKLSAGQVLAKAAIYIAKHADDTGSVRYVYTTAAGWIDEKHFFAAAQSTAVRGEAMTNVFGLGLELSQVGTNSFFSYEDLGSNRAGADFGDNVFYPDGSPLSSQAAAYLNSLGATDPENAPNFIVLPQQVDRGGSSGGPGQSGQKGTPGQVPCVVGGDTPCPQ